jgi:hypothetical protein
MFNEKGMLEGFENVKRLLDGVPLDTSAIDKLFERYVAAKSWMFPFFDENGKLELVLDEKELVLESNLNAFHELFMETYTKMYTSKDKFSTINKDKCLALFKAFINNFSYAEVVKNEVAEDKSFHGKVFKKGMKISKVLNQIGIDGMESYSLVKMCRLSLRDRNSYNEEECTAQAKVALDLLLTAYSVVLTTSKDMKITVVLSINPLDYLISSNHTTGWRSCHSWCDGEYRAGSLSYMTDEVSAVAYAYLDNGPYKHNKVEISSWPIKKWRQMVFFDKANSSIVFSREYPSQNAAFAKATRKIAYTVIDRFNKLETSKYTTISYANAQTYAENEVVSNNTGAKFTINNLGGGYYDSPTLVAKLNDKGAMPNINIGFPYPCPACGVAKADTRRSHLLCNCPSKGNTHTCSKCGERFEDEDNLYSYRGAMYCEDCLDDISCVCEGCGERISRDDSNSYDGYNYCSGCFDERYCYCEECESDFPREDEVCVRSEDGEEFYCCSHCAENKYKYCVECEKWYETATHVNGEHVCAKCLAKNYTKCPSCSDYFKNDEMSCIDGKLYCEDCAGDKIVDKVEDTPKKKISLEKISANAIVSTLAGITTEKFAVCTDTDTRFVFDIEEDGF